MTRGDATDIAAALRKLTDRLDRRSGAARKQARLNQVWASVAGPTVGLHTGRVHERAGELIVDTDSPAWATELQALAETYRQAINTELGQETVKTIRFTVSRRVQELRQGESAERSLQGPRPDNRQRGKLTENELAQVVASAEAIPNEKVREAVIRATVADLEWKKGAMEDKEP